MPFFEYISTSRKKTLKKYTKTWDIISIRSSFHPFIPFSSQILSLSDFFEDPSSAACSRSVLAASRRNVSKSSRIERNQGKPPGNGRSLPHLPVKRPAGIRWWKYLGNLWRKLLSAPACLVFVLLAEYFLKPPILSSLKKSGPSDLLRWNRQGFGSYECGPKEYRSKNVSGLRGVRTTSFHSCSSGAAGSSVGLGATSKPPSLTHHQHPSSICHLWVKLIYPVLRIVLFQFFSIFSEFSETQKLQLFPSPERQMLARTLWRSRPAFCSKEFLLRKIRISAAQLPRQPIHGFTNTFIFSGYKGYMMISSVPLWKPPRERNATTTLPPENLAKTSPPFVGFLPHLSFRNLSSLTKDSCSGLGLEHQKYWQVFPWKKPVCLS